MLKVALHDVELGRAEVMTEQALLQSSITKASAERREESEKAWSRTRRRKACLVREISVWVE